MPHALFQEPARQLFEPLVSQTCSLVSNRFNVRSKRVVPPVIPRRLFSITRDAVARRLEQRASGSGIKTGIIAQRKVELAPGSTSVVSIIVDERSGH